MTDDNVAVSTSMVMRKQLDVTVSRCPRDGGVHELMRRWTLTPADPFPTLFDVVEMQQQSALPMSDEQVFSVVHALAALLCTWTMPEIGHEVTSATPKPVLDELRRSGPTGFINVTSAFVLHSLLTRAQHDMSLNDARGVPYVCSYVLPAWCARLVDYTAIAGHASRMLYQLSPLAEYHMETGHLYRWRDSLYAVVDGDDAYAEELSGTAASQMHARMVRADQQDSYMDVVDASSSPIKPDQVRNSGEYFDSFIHIVLRGFQVGLGVDLVLEAMDDLYEDIGAKTRSGEEPRDFNTFKTFFVKHVLTGVRLMLLHGPTKELHDLIRSVGRGSLAIEACPFKIPASFYHRGLTELEVQGVVYIVSIVRPCLAPTMEEPFLLKRSKTLPRLCLQAM